MTQDAGGEGNLNVQVGAVIVTVMLIVYGLFTSADYVRNLVVSYATPLLLFVGLVYFDAVLQSHFRSIEENNERILSLLTDACSHLDAIGRGAGQVDD